jgi:dTDP-4-amino-4,6-dideoxygalactose transaminase
MLDVGAANAECQSAIDGAIRRVLASGWFILGDEVAEFERAWAAYAGARYCVGVACGLDALHLALLAAGIGNGSEVIVPSNTYIATWLAVSHAGATPVPVEPDAATYNVDPSRIEMAITSRTRAILPTHLYGQPADMDRINEIASHAVLRVVEDAAQAQGARYQGRPVGALSDATAWSFYPTKNLGALGDGGAVTTNNAEIADQVRRLRNYGSTSKYVNDVLGYNSRLDELQAAVLSVKLQVLDEWNERRRSIARRYLDAFASTRLQLPTVPDWATPVWHLFVVRSPQRAELRAHLAAHGVEASLHYPIPPHLQGAYHHLGIARGSLPISESIHDEVLSLPIGPHLTTDQVDRVIEAVLSFPGGS